MPFDSNAPAVSTYPAVQPGHQRGSAGGSMAGSAVIENVYSVYDPFSIQRLAYKRHGIRPTFADMMDMMGPDYNRGVKAPTTGHYEQNNWVGQQITVGAIEDEAGGAGNSMDIELATVNMADLGVAINGDPAYSSSVRVGDLILLTNGKLAYVSSKNGLENNPNIITITPFDSTLDLDSVVLADQVLSIVTNAHASATGLPEGLVPSTFQYTNKFQIVKEAAHIAGDELTNEPFVQIVEGENSVFAVMRQDMMDRFNRARGGALTWGEENDNVSVTNSQLGYDTPITWTEGFMSFMTGNSYSNTYNPAAFDLDELTEIAATFEAENIGTRTICSLQGHRYSYLMETALDNKFDQSLSNAMIVKALTGYGLSMDDWQPIIEQQDWVAWLGWQGVRRSNFNFHFRMMHEFVAPDGAGGSSYTYPYNAIYLPLSMQRDRKTGTQRPSIGYEWKQLGSYSRKMVFGTFAGAGAAGVGGYVEVPVDQYDRASTFMICEHAFHGSCPNKIIYHEQE